jgi:hypothetical protein
MFLMRKKDSTTACRRLVVRASPGTEPWVPDPATLQRLACLLTSDVEVEIYPRMSVAPVWAREHGGDRSSLPTDPYAFRAWSREGRAILFVDDTETKDSILWLLVHELAHLDLPHSRLLRSAYRDRVRHPDYLKNDQVHEADPEEQLANLVADEVVARLGRPSGLHRLWWRRRVDQKVGLHPLARSSVSR